MSASWQVQVCQFEPQALRWGALRSIDSNHVDQAKDGAPKNRIETTYKVNEGPLSEWLEPLDGSRETLGRSKVNQGWKFAFHLLPESGMACPRRSGFSLSVIILSCSLPSRVIQDLRENVFAGRQTCMHTEAERGETGKSASLAALTARSTLMVQDYDMRKEPLRSRLREKCGLLLSQHTLIIILTSFDSSNHAVRPQQLTFATE